MSEYVDRNWNGRPNGPSPAMFAGVRPTEELDEDGFVVYEIEPWLRTLLDDRRTGAQVVVSELE